MRTGSVSRLGVQLLALLTLCGATAQAQETTTVLVVRHAEKEWEDGDPPLSEVGWQRAEALLRLAEESGVSVLFGTQYMRTTQTLEPIAESLVLEILTHDAGDSEGLAARILSEYAGKVIVVSGHSNTVTKIVAALGAPEPPPIEDWDYDDVFVVTIGPDETVTAVHLSYGVPSASPVP